MKLKRGQKLCKSCNSINGARAHACKQCSAEFVSTAVKSKNKFRKKKVKKYTEIDWTTLAKGDQIRVMGRSGNYYIGESGERMYMSSPGIYTVNRLDSNGLVVYSSEGYGYIYMGPEKQSDILSNMYRSPHKIYKYTPPNKLS
jgi:hypothetical protein